MPSSSEFLPLIGTSAPAPSHFFGWRLRRRCRRIPTVRLGGEKKGGFWVGRFYRKARKVKWLKLKYLRMVRRVKKCYETVVEDLAMGRKTTEEFQRRMVVEAAAVIPVTSF